MDGLNDPSLDRELESLLATEPSPEFIARVRARVAEEPTPNRWRTSWTFAAATAVAVAIVALTVWPPSEPAPSSSAPVEVPRIANSVETITPPAPTRLLTQRTTARAVVVAASSDRAIEIDLPEVVVADNEKVAFATLVARIRQSRFDAAVPAAPDLDRPLEIKELQAVEPIEIEPLVKLAVLQTEGERP